MSKKYFSAHAFNAKFPKRFQEIVSTLGLENRLNHLPASYPVVSSSVLPLGVRSSTALQSTCSEPTGNLDRKTLRKPYPFSNCPISAMDKPFSSSRTKKLHCKPMRIITLEDGHIIRDEAIV